MGTIEKLLGGPLLDAWIDDSWDWTAEDHEALAEYFEAHGWLPQSGEVEEGDVPALSAQLEAAEQDRELRKRALIRLAHCASPEAGAVLRSYQDRVDPGLRRFAQLALEESLTWTAGR